MSSNYLPPMRQRAPYRHSADATHVSPNQLYVELQLDEEFVNDDGWHRPGLYVPRRPRAGGSERWRSVMPERFPAEYAYNEFHRAGSIGSEGVPGEFAARATQFTEDLAEVALLYRISRVVEQRDPPVSARLLVLQGGIGEGKTTLLDHFGQYVYASAIDGLGLGKAGPFTRVDFHFDLAPDGPLDMDRLYDRMARKLTAADPWLGTVEGWTAISAVALAAAGPAIAIEPSREAQDAIKRRIIQECLNDKEFCRRALAYLSAEGRMPAIVFDNVDAQPEDVQVQMVHVLAGLLADAGSAVGIIALREYTLNGRGMLGALSSFGPVHALHITAPALDEVLAGRFALAAQRVVSLMESPEGEPPYIAIGNGARVGIGNVERFLDVWRRCLLTEQTVRWIRCLANGSLRLELALARSAMASPAFRVDRFAVDLYSGEKTPRQVQEAYRVDESEFIRHAYLGTVAGGPYSMYTGCADDSLVPNLLNHADEAPTLHSYGRSPVLVQYRLFGYILRHRECPVADVRQAMQCYDYTPEAVSRMLEWGRNNYLIESRQGHDVASWVEVFSTRKLAFYLDFFVTRLASLDNLRNDVYVTYDSEAYTKGGGPRRHTRDLIELAAFIAQVADYERVEATWMRTHHRLPAYRQLLGNDVPLCWRILGDVLHQVRDDERRLRGLIGDVDEWHRMLESFREVARQIRGLFAQGEIEAWSLSPEKLPFEDWVP